MPARTQVRRAVPGSAGGGASDTLILPVGAGSVPLIGSDGPRPLRIARLTFANEAYLSSHLRGNPSHGRTRHLCANRPQPVELAAVDPDCRTFADGSLQCLLADAVRFSALLLAAAGVHRGRRG